ncbi:MAG: DUF6279 family lipoprotein, partial [Proteobacteria bacterium]|nr:DUF6279 family lipoprotein [Pseudomonadota bacterium]
LYQIDDYVDLSSTQKQQLKIPLHETVDWFKGERLPDLISLLRENVQMIANRKIDGGQFDKNLLLLGRWRSELTERLTMPFVLVLKNLDSDQIQRLQKKLKKDNVSLTELLETGEEDFASQLQDYIDDSSKSLKFWFGKLRPQQKKMMAEILQFDRVNLSEQLRQRKRIQEYWLGLIKAGDLQVLIRAVKDTAEPIGAFNDPEYIRYRAESRERWRKFMLELLASLDEEQWQHLHKAMDGLLQDMEEFVVKKK